jgi:hexosaminidase
VTPTADRLELVPPPRILDRGAGSFPIPGGLVDAAAAFTVGAAAAPGLTAAVDRGAVPHPQGYHLTVRRDSLSLLAADPAGMFYGMMTLRQLLRQARHPGTLPCLSIEDWPELPVRAVMLDISRDRVPTMETLKRLIGLWAELKYNQVQLYTEHTFAYPAHPEVWRAASPLTPAEVEELDRFCAARAIELVANQNSFGHMERWLRHPAYKRLADATGPFPDPWGGWQPEPTTLNPLDPGSIELVASLYEELFPHFRSRQVNVGADEPIDLGHGRSAEAVRQLGAGRVYLDFLTKLHTEVTRRGRTMQAWADFLVRSPEVLSEVPRDLTALEWGYEHDHPFAAECRLLADAGLRFFVCPGTSSWNSIGGRGINARAAIRAAVREGLAAGASGFLIADWGDNGHWQQLPVSYPAWLCGAAAAWCPGREGEVDLERALSLHVLCDPAGGAARALLALQEVCTDEPARLHNATMLAVLLILRLQPYHEGTLQKFRGYAFQGEHARILEAGRYLSNARPPGADGKLLVEEIAFTADLMEHAVRLGRARFATAGLSTAEVPGEVRGLLSEELGGLVERYRRLWAARSRPGGLEDSAGRLLVLRETYREN